MAAAGLLVDLVHLLKDASQEVRKGAIEAVVGVSTQPATIAFFQQQGDALRVVFALTRDNLLVAHDAYRALVNLTGHEAIARHLESADALEAIVKTILTRDAVLADMACMLLANLSMHKDVFELLYNVTIDTSNGSSQRRPAGAAVAALVHAFSLGRQYNSRADYHFLASVLANITQFVEARRLLSQGEEPLLRLVIPSLRSDNLVRRGGAASAIKNCLFDTNTHEKLVNKYDLLELAFVPMAIRSDFKDEELKEAPQYIKDLPEAKQREPDVGIRLILLEILLMIASTKSGRERMRTAQVYCMVRNFHLEGNLPEPIEGTIDGLVNMLIRDEESESAQLPAPETISAQDDEITLVE